MRRTIHKWFWVWSFDKEEKWLNEMAAKGLHLVSVGYCKYVFEEGIPGDYAIRLELLDNFPTHPESLQYIRFIEDTGAEYLGSVMRWVYFRKHANADGFDLYSDIDSRISQLKRILFFILPFALLQFTMTMSNLSVYFSSNSISSLVVSMLTFLLGCLLGYGFIRIYLKMRRLSKERALHE